MKKIVFLLTFTILHLAIQAQQKYVYAIDIKNIEKDQISVLLTCPEIKENEIIFVIPRVIPGSYSDDKYAQFVKNFKALDASGNKLPIKFIDKSHFIIYNATKLKTLTYNVSDTWDEKSKKKYLFEPGGSNIESNKNIVLNNHAFFGYFEGYKNLAFEINVTKPETFFASTYLSKSSPNSTLDILKADTYFELGDNPVLYCKPDTSSFKISNTTIYISVYNENSSTSSKEIATLLQPLAKALEVFLMANFLQMNIGF